MSSPEPPVTILGVGRMIALVRVLGPRGAGNGIAELTALPEPPASRYTAFAVRCRNEIKVAEAVVWYRALIESRPSAPLGLIARARDCIQPIAGLGHSLVFVKDPTVLVGGGLPESSLAALRGAGIQGRILTEIVNDHGPEVLSKRESLMALIASAVTGGTLRRAAKYLCIHPDTLSRRLKRVGLSPRLLRRQVRVRAYELRVEMGAERSVALTACGWTDHKHRRKATARLGEKRS